MLRLVINKNILNHNVCWLIKITTKSHPKSTIFEGIYKGLI